MPKRRDRSHHPSKHCRLFHVQDQAAAAGSQTVPDGRPQQPQLHAALLPAQETLHLGLGHRQPNGHHRGTLHSSSFGCLSGSLLCLSVSVNQTVVIWLFLVFAVSVCFCQPNGCHQAVFLCLCCVCLFLSTKRLSSGCLSVSLLCLSVSVNQTVVIRLSFCVFAVSVCFCQPNSRHGGTVPHIFWLSFWVCLCQPNSHHSGIVQLFFWLTFWVFVVFVCLSVCLCQPNSHHGGMVPFRVSVVSVYVNQTAITEVWCLSESLLCLSACLCQPAITTVRSHFSSVLFLFFSPPCLCCVRLFLSTKEPPPRYGPLFLFWRSLCVSVSVLFVYLPVMFVYSCCF